MTGAVTTTLDVEKVAAHIANLAADSYGAYCERDDLLQEVRLYVVANRSRIDKWIADGETSRVWRACFGVCKQYAEREKAAALGYDFSDLAWYSPEKVAHLIPVALDETWDGLSGASDEEQTSSSRVGREGGNLVAMVMDVRRAIGKLRLSNMLADYDPDDEAGSSRLRKIADFLGGEYPDAEGYRPRRSRSNNAAAKETHDMYGGNE